VTSPNLSTIASELTNGISLLNASVRRLTEKVRTSRVLLIVTIIGLIIDLSLSGLFYYQHSQQSHLNNRIVCLNKVVASQKDFSLGLYFKDQQALIAFLKGATKATGHSALQQPLLQTYQNALAKDNALRLGQSKILSSSC
jgi:hypothetical protein